MVGSRYEALVETIRGEPLIRKISGFSFSGKVYLAGGAIRELLLGKVPRDYDFALTDERDLLSFGRIFRSHPFLMGKKPIQTYRLIAEDNSIDITFVKGSIEEDLLRRDFTMNAVAYDVAGRAILDPLGGMADAEEGVIRYPRQKSISDDPLRMIKAVRHFTILEGFSIHPDLTESIRRSAPLIRETAPERVKFELDQIMGSDGVYRGVTMLDELGLLRIIFPELDALKRMDVEKGFVPPSFGHTIEGFQYLSEYGRRYRVDHTARRHVAYGLLFHDLGKAQTFSYDETKKSVHFFHHERVSLDLSSRIMDRFRFSNAEAKTVVELIRNHMRIFLISNRGPTEKAIRRIVYRMGDLTPSLIVLTLCDMYGSSEGQENPSTAQVAHACNEILSSYEEWQKEPLPRLLTGHDLLSLGFPEGPIIGEVLRQIKDKQIGGEIRTGEEAMTYARTRLSAARSLGVGPGS
jgi:tRNA nucleotidyltransferase/poly(A) polymerase